MLSFLVVLVRGLPIPLEKRGIRLEQVDPSVIVVMKRIAMIWAWGVFYSGLVSGFGAVHKADVCIYGALAQGWRLLCKPCGWAGPR